MIKTTRSPSPTASTTLLFWLLIVCGLAGITAQRLDAVSDVLPLWLGTVGGVAIGQLVGALRVRAWLLAMVIMGGLWFTSVLFAAMSLRSYRPRSAGTCRSPTVADSSRSGTPPSCG